MAKDESLGSIVGGLLGAFANEVDIFSGPEKSGPNNTAGDASHSQSGGLFGGESSGSSEQKGDSTVHHGSKGTETGRTESHGSNLTHFDAGSSFFGGLDRQQTGHTVVDGNRSSNYDNSGNLIGWSITHDNGRIDSYDRNGNHTYTSHTSVNHTPKTIPARIGNGLSSVAKQIHDSAPWSTRGNVEGGSSEFRARAARSYTATRPINIDWVIVGRCAIAVIVLSLFVGLCTAVVRSMNGQAAATKSKVSRSWFVDKSGRVASGTHVNDYVGKTPPKTDQPKQGAAHPFILHRSDGTTQQLSDHNVGVGILEGKYHVDNNGNVTESQDPTPKSKTSRSWTIDKDGRVVTGKPVVNYVGDKTSPTSEQPKRTPHPFVLRRSDGTTKILSDHDVGTGILEGRYHVGDDGTVTESQATKSNKYPSTKPMNKEDFRRFLQETSGPCATWPKHKD